MTLLDRLRAAGLSDRVRLLNRDPWVGVIDDFLDEADIEALCAAAASRFEQPMVDDGTVANNLRVRTGGVAWVEHRYAARTQALAERTAALIGLPLRHAESFQVVRYGADQRYLAHYDGYDMATAAGQANEARGGQRLATALFYLRAPTAGGATAFPQLQLDVGARPGRLLLFWNVASTDARRPHPDALHAGQPVLGGEKWIANLWFRQRPYTAV